MDCRDERNMFKVKGFFFFNFLVQPLILLPWFLTVANVYVSAWVMFLLLLSSWKLFGTSCWSWDNLQSISFNQCKPCFPLILIWCILIFHRIKSYLCSFSGWFSRKMLLSQQAGKVWSLDRFSNYLSNSAFLVFYGFMVYYIKNRLCVILIHKWWDGHAHL